MASTSDIYVWAWLPETTAPVPAGRLREGAPGQFSFDYGRRYLARGNAISLAPTLPLSQRTFGPTGSLGLPGALRDASPDAWAGASFSTKSPVTEVTPPTRVTLTSAHTS